jgi:hypothetical protein
MWKKSAASTYVADWMLFNVRGRSVRQLAKYGIITGLIWGVLVVKVFTGLPGDKAREYMGCSGVSCIK